MKAFESPSKENFFGTDEFGATSSAASSRNRESLFQVGMIAVGIAVVSEAILGSVAGYYGGRTNNLIM